MSAAALLLVLALAAAACGAPTGERGGASPPAPEPPGVDGDLPMALSADRVPASGAVVVLAVVNPTGSGLLYGVSGTVERWDGAGWQPHGTFTTSLDFWGGAGAVHAPGEQVAVQDIGVTAPAGAAGPLEWLATDGLAPGTYRLSRTEVPREGRRRTAAALLTVVDDDAVPAPDVGRGRAPLLTTSPQVLPAGAPAEVRIAATDPAATTAADIDPLQAGLEPTATLQRWQDGWTDVAVLEVDAEPEHPSGNIREQAVELPALDPGSYRLARRSGDVVLHGHLLVTGALP